jgi:dipeptidyl-peptidase-4
MIYRRIFTDASFVNACTLSSLMWIALCASPMPGRAQTAASDHLTLDRIFLEEPPLDGVSPRGLAWSPDGKKLGFLRPSPESRDVLELWVYEVEKGASRPLLKASDLLTGEAQELSDEEIQILERKRITQRGITSYEWSPDGRALLVPLSGLYVYDLEEGRTFLIDDGEKGPLLDPHFSPDGRFVSFVRDGEIWIVPREGGRGRQLTEGASPTLSHGLAEFIAMEEMDRDEGYWWSEDSKKIAYLEVDESGVDVWKRARYEAEGSSLAEQRYPAAGRPNAKVRAGILDVASGKTRWLDLGQDVEYIARVDWSPDSKSLAIQVEPRNQKEVRLLMAEPESGRVRTVFIEREDTYVNLHGDFRFLRDGRFLWSSERTGLRQLFLYDPRGNLLGQVTRQDSPVLALKGVDEEERVLFFSAAARGGLECRLYRQAIAGGEAVSLTPSEGWHSTLMSEDARFYADIHSSLSGPPRATLHDASGRELAVLEENPTPELDRLLRSNPEFLQVRAADGHTQLNAVMTKPPDFDPSRRYPVLMYGYGGPGGQEVANRWSGMIPWDQFLADHGYIMFSVDPRGSALRGKVFEEEIYMRMGVVEVEDHAAAVAYLRSLPYVDAARIGIWGWSYGGSLVLMSLLATEDLYRCGIAVAPVTDWHLYDTHYTERYLGLPEENPEAYLAASPLAQDPAEISEALLLVHGMADDNVFLDNTLAMTARLQEAGVPFELMLYPGKTHLIGGKTAKRHLYGLFFDFLERRMAP